MKRLLTLAICLFTVSAALLAQPAEEAPYKKFPTYPPVKLLMPDSVSYYSKDKLPKKKPVMLMLFNPMCDHCKHETEEIVKHIDQFKNVQIVMATTMPYDSMMSFRERYQLGRFDNIVVTQDVNFFLPTFYMIHNLPFLAFYNKKKELISVFEGSMPIEKVLEELKK